MTRACRFDLRLGGPGYPLQLSLTPRPPHILHGIGDQDALTPGLAVIGSRKATPYGLDCASTFAACAAEAGVPVVSGGAMGCDLAAHRAALAAGGTTVAVLGCGADVDYPARAADVLSVLRAGRGAVVSEIAWGVQPARWHFPERNRIIAGLSQAVLVVEAALPSGTFSTADHALAAGRDVLAVPGSVFSAMSAGCNRLISQGATPICCVEDLLDALAAAGLAGADMEQRTLGPCGAIPPGAASEDPLLRALLATPMSADSLAAALGMEIRSVLHAVATLESLGRVARYPDGRYGPCAAR